MAGCGAAPRPTLLYQTAPIKSILAGVDEGEATCGGILAQGDFGIGTLDGIDGELVVLGGRCYQVTSDGKVRVVPAAAPTPWAAVTRFVPKLNIPVGGQGSGEPLDQQLDRVLAPDNRCYAVRVKGTFDAVKLRAFPRQSRPYPRLADITSQQKVFEHARATGVLVGFRMPSWADGINVPGYHFHFVDDARASGGHVLAASISDAVVEIMPIDEIRVVVPQSDEFAHKDLVDHGRELDKVERK